MIFEGPEIHSGLFFVKMELEMPYIEDMDG